MTDLSSDPPPSNTTPGERAHRLTRRSVLGAGLAFASVACSAEFGASGTSTPVRRETSAIDALLIDDSLELPRPLMRFIDASRRTVPVIAVQLDAAAHTALTRILQTTRALVGVSSGATLFCLERIAWDQGFRLLARSHWSASDPGAAQGPQALAAFLNGARAPIHSPSPLVRAYRPSRSDALLHAWVMQKSTRTPVSQGRQEI